MAYDYNNQFLGRCSNHTAEFGKQAFSTTDLTVEVPVASLEVVKSVNLEFAQTPTGYETLYSDGVVTNQNITVGRVITPVYLQTAASGTIFKSSNDWYEVPLGVVPVDGTITSLSVFNTTKGGGSPVALLGIVTDSDKFLASSKAEAMPSDGVTKTITDFTLATVTAGESLLFSTTGGTSTDPAGLMVQIKITPTPTSALEFYYRFLGV